MADDRRSVEVVLKRGFFDETKNERVTVLAFREPTMRDLARADTAAKGKGEVERMMHLIAICTGRDPAAIGAMKNADIELCVEKIDELMRDDDTGEASGSPAPTS